MSTPTLGGPTPEVTPQGNPNPAPNDPGNPVVAVVTDPPTPAPSGNPDTDAVARARQQEKEKLHTQMEQRDSRLAAMEAELNTLRAEREAKSAAEAASAAALAEAERLKSIAEASAKDLVLQTRTELEEKLAQMQNEREIERVAMAKEVEFNQLRAYIQAQVRENSDEIAPQLLDLVSGDTREEVDASIARMKTKTTEILESVKAAQTQQRSQMRGVSVASSPGGADAMSGQARQLTLDELKKMPLSEFSKYRGQLGVTGNSNNTSRGLFD